MEFILSIYRSYLKYFRKIEIEKSNLIEGFVFFILFSVSLVVYTDFTGMQEPNRSLWIPGAELLLLTILLMLYCSKYPKLSEMIQILMALSVAYVYTVLSLFMWENANVSVKLFLIVNTMGIGYLSFCRLAKVLK